MVEWPALLQSPGSDELMYVPSVARWHALKTSSEVQSGDRLIDSRGALFTIVADEPTGPEVQLTLDEVIILVRQHASLCGHCCVSKLGASGIAEAVAMVRGIE
jgi:hypothetical protein